MIRIALFLLLTVLTASAQTPGAGRAVTFNGTTSHYVIANPFNGFPSTALTVEFWLWSTDDTKAGTPFSYAVSGEDNMLFIHDYRDLRFRLGGTAIPSSGATGVAVNNGQWHHIAITWTRSGGNFMLYVDGNVRYNATGVRTNLTIPSGGALVLGQEQDSVGGGFETAEAFLGNLDEVRVWNVARSSFSIRNDMHRSLVGTENGLVLYYRMDETSGNLVDSTGDGHTGTVFGTSRINSGAPIGLPTEATTFDPSNVSTLSANFRGSVDPNGLASIGFFEYGTNINLLTNTPASSISAGATPTQISRSVTLRQSTTYYCRAVGSNVLGTDRGTTIAFSTFGRPSVITASAVEVTSDSATLTGSVNPRGTPAIAYFQYGLTTNYTFTTSSTNVGTGFSELPAAMRITDLIFDTNYQYRCVASNSYGITYGPNRTFRTQVFGDIAAGITGLSHASVAWGDYDNDGDLDLLMAGSTNNVFSQSLTRLWRNDGDGAFTSLNLGLPAVATGAARWGDFDNDGWLDFVLMGYSNTTNICQIYRNNRNGTFTDINAGLAAISDGSADWGDYDNDGDLDLLVTGATIGGAFTTPARIYRNNGNATFTDLQVPLPALIPATAAWGDYDNDGDLDFVLSGRGTNGTMLARIYRNNGNASFTDINAGLAGMSRGALAWGDFDNDGDLDLLMVGSTNHVQSGASTHLWRNNGNSTFSLVNHSLPRVMYSAAAWGDYDNDGDLDLALSGLQPNDVPLTELHRNNGNGTFTRLNVAMDGLQYSALAWGDYDNDNDLDLIVLGAAPPNLPVTQLRRNDSFPANTLPAAPTGLASALNGSNLTLSWQSASDAQTPTSALTYNIRVTPAVMEADAHPATGHRRVVDIGNVQFGTNVTLVFSNFPSGTYHWTVQAIDTAFAGGPFAAVETIELPGRPNIIAQPPVNVTTDTATLQALINPGGRNTSASFDFGTTTTYGTQLGNTNIGNGYSNILITADVTSLSPDTVYHYRATALNVFGPASGEDVTFRTAFFSVQPPSLALVLPPGTATNISLTFSNHIASAVNVTNRFIAPMPSYALLLNPTFTLPANATADLNLLFDSTDLAPNTYEATLEIVSGSTHAIVQVPIQLTIVAAEPAEINSISLQPNGSMLLNFIGTSGYTQTVFASTNLQDWTAIGPATQISPGRFQFTDLAATNFTQRFYRIRTP